MRIYKFNPDSKYTLEDVKTSIFYAMCEKADNGDTSSLFNYLWQHCKRGMESCRFNIVGWRIDLRPYLNRYWVKLKDGYIVEEYLPLKKYIRHCYGSHNVVEIVELENKYRR